MFPWRWHRSPLVLLALLLVSGHVAQARRKPQVTQTQEYLHLSTSHGDIVVALLHKDAPRTTRLVKRLAKAQLYDGAAFYRAEPGFVVQGGLREPSGATRPNPYGPVPLEARLSNLVSGHVPIDSYCIMLFSLNVLAVCDCSAGPSRWHGSKTRIRARESFSLT